MKTPTTLIIMDGFALGDDIPGNAVRAANTPQLDYLFSQYPFCQLSASGLDVGLPEGQMGNSEVGHTNIGAGRVVFQDLPRISRAIEDGSFFENPAYLKAVKACKESGSALHLMGLLSDGGVHSHITHLYALLELAKRHGLEKVFVHVFLDGRDVSPTSGLGFVQALQEKLAELGVGKIADISGRYYAMDRDSRWERLQRAYDAMVHGDAPVIDDPAAAVQASYDAGVTDEFMEPVICDSNGRIQSGDSVIFYNFRPDRAREITRSLTDPAFGKLVRKKGFFPLTFICTTEYDASLPNVTVAFPHEPLVNIFGAYLSQLGMTQLRIAETEKYAHVTFFFNGGVERVCEGEERCLVPSPKEYATYDLIPQMSAEKVADKVVEAIASEQYALIVCNFANCDMVGHTGVMEAAVKAVETVDGCMGRIIAEVEKHEDLVLLVTADHGNADCMFDETGKVNTAHTTNPVPFCVRESGIELKPGRLADIAPTILKLMGLEQPAEMTGECLVK